MNPQRRRVLIDSSIVAVGATLGLPVLGATVGRAPRGADTVPDVHIELTAIKDQVAIRPGKQTQVWRYSGKLVRGDPGTLEALPNSYLGPTIRVRRGQHVRVDFINQLPESTIINWHGLHVPALMMGLPRYAVKPGERYRYEFQVNDRAGAYWYHAMAAGHTPEQMYFGLAGLLLVSDDEEQALPLPRGEYDLPIVLQDRTWGEDNQFRYLPDTGPAAVRHGSSSESPATRRGMMGRAMQGQGMMGSGMMSGGAGGMMTRLMGFFGDTILVNGRPKATFELAAHAYRLRVLNASNARTYKLAWQDGRPLTVIATDGGLLERPIHKDYVMLTPGQRIELWVDFSQDAIGTELTMTSLAFSSVMNMMGGGGMMNHSSLADGAPFPIFRVKVTRKASEILRLPEQLSTLTRLRAEDAVNRDNQRVFRVTMSHMQWGFNDRSFQMNEVAPDETVKLDTTEVWEFANNMMMAHAIHLHGLQFQVLERINSPRNAGVVDGYVDGGWVDTVLLMPNERIRLLMHFADFTGTYAYQCHMLEHAAMGLMRNYEVKAASPSA